MVAKRRVGVFSDQLVLVRFITEKPHPCFLLLKPDEMRLSDHIRPSSRLAVSVLDWDWPADGWMGLVQVHQPS
ncbi:unnamed protein product [Pleuronectes platessa]|uniref:Uncharacterized protein n=1 Tax=Pleuronectes platessa TaxID=8262 RepID=A0A9N7Z1L6_PLEPL|nr:unnamed protein product [Pleuronectes platessa]